MVSNLNQLKYQNPKFQNRLQVIHLLACLFYKHKALLDELQQLFL